MRVHGVSVRGYVLLWVCAACVHADAPKPERGTCVCACAMCSVCVCYVQRLELLRTLMLAWQWQRTMDAGGVRHTGALMMVALLPSRLLAIIGREVLKLPLEARCRQPAGIWHAPRHSVPSSPSQPKCGSPSVALTTHPGCGFPLARVSRVHCVPFQPVLTNIGKDHERGEARGDEHGSGR